MLPGRRKKPKNKHQLHQTSHSGVNDTAWQQFTSLAHSLTTYILCCLDPLATFKVIRIIYLYFKILNFFDSYKIKS